MVKGSMEGSVWQTVRNCVANLVFNLLPLKSSLIETSSWNLRYPPVGTDARFLCQVQQPLLTLSTDLIIFCFFVFFRLGFLALVFYLWTIIVNTSRHFIIRKRFHFIFLVVSSMAFSFINFVRPFLHSDVIEGLNQLSAMIHIVALFLWS